MSEKITYLVRVYQSGRFADDLVTSLEAQTSPDWLALVLDDGSRDDCVELWRRRLAASPVRDKVTLLVAPENRGCALGMHALILASATDLVGVLDGDDALMPEATEEILRFYREHPEAEFVYSRMANCDASLRDLGTTGGEEIPEGGSTFHGGCVDHLRTFRVRAYLRTGGIDPTMGSAEDRDLVYKLEEVARPWFLDRVLYRYRILDRSETRDPIRGARGTWNRIRARRNTYRRRGIRGLRYLALRIIDSLDYPHPLVRLLWPIQMLLIGLDRIFRFVPPLGPDRGSIGDALGAGTDWTPASRFAPERSASQG